MGNLVLDDAFQEFGKVEFGYNDERELYYIQNEPQEQVA